MLKQPFFQSIVWNKSYVFNEDSFLFLNDVISGTVI